MRSACLHGKHVAVARNAPLAATSPSAMHVWSKERTVCAQVSTLALGIEKQWQVNYRLQSLVGWPMFVEWALRIITYVSRVATKLHDYWAVGRAREALGLLVCWF